MLVGIVPFYNKNQNLLFDNILEKEVVFREEDILSENAKNLMLRVHDDFTQLLNKNPALRMGAKGADEIKCHSWFNGVNFVDVLNKKVKPPLHSKAAKQSRCYQLWQGIH
jgi:hypothetical protein